MGRIKFFHYRLAIDQHDMSVRIRRHCKARGVNMYAISMKKYKRNKSAGDAECEQRRPMRRRGLLAMFEVHDSQNEVAERGNPKSGAFPSS